LDGEGGYAWGRSQRHAVLVDRKNNLFAIFMVQTQLYRSPAYGDFKRLVAAVPRQANRRNAMRMT